MPAVGTWDTTLTGSGDIKVFPVNPAGVTACTNNVKSGYCFSPNAAATDYIVYSHLESKSEAAKCAGTAANTWYVYSSADGKAGTYCNAAQPTGATAPFGANLLP